MKSTHTIATYHVQQKLKEIKDDDLKALKQFPGTSEVPEKVDFLTYIIHSGQMGLEDAVVNSIDLISGGVDTVSEH